MVLPNVMHGKLYGAILCAFASRIPVVSLRMNNGGPALVVSVKLLSWIFGTRTCSLHVAIPRSSSGLTVQRNRSGHQRQTLSGQLRTLHSITISYSTPASLDIRLDRPQQCFQFAPSLNPSKHVSQLPPTASPLQHGLNRPFERPPYDHPRENPWTATIKHQLQLNPHLSQMATHIPWATKNLGANYALFSKSSILSSPKTFQSPLPPPSK